MQCDATKRALTKAAITHTVVDVTEAPEALTAIKALGYAGVRRDRGREPLVRFQPDCIKALTPAT